MSDELRNKVIMLAAQICWKHGELAGDRTCQDWEGDTDVLDSLTNDERNTLMHDYDEYNSGGEEFIPGYFPYDEMMISYVVALQLEKWVTPMKREAT